MFVEIAYVIYVTDRKLKDAATIYGFDSMVAQSYGPLLLDLSSVPGGMHLLTVAKGTLKA